MGEGVRREEKKGAVSGEWKGETAVRTTAAPALDARSSHATFSAPSPSSKDGRMSGGRESTWPPRRRWRRRARCASYASSTAMEETARKVGRTCTKRPRRRRYCDLGEAEGGCGNDYPQNEKCTQLEIVQKRRFCRGMGKFINLVLHARRSGPRMGHSNKGPRCEKKIDLWKMLRYGRM